MIPGATVEIRDGAEGVDDDSIALLLDEAAAWHRVAQLAVSSVEHDAARNAYRMREILARYIAARSTLGFHEARARAIILSRSLD